MIQASFNDGKYKLFNVCFINDMIQWVTTSTNDGDWKSVSWQLLQAISKSQKKNIGFDLDEVDQMALEYKNQQEWLPT